MLKLVVRNVTGRP